MPKISEFFGISIYIYYREHHPAHFHAIYGDQEAIIQIDNLQLMRGRLSPRAMGLVLEWALSHQKELRKIWEKALEHEPLGKVKPLQ